MFSGTNHIQSLGVGLIGKPVSQWVGTSGEKVQACLVLIAIFSQSGAGICLIRSTSL